MICKHQTSLLEKKPFVMSITRHLLHRMTVERLSLIPVSRKNHDSVYMSW